MAVHSLLVLSTHPWADKQLLALNPHFTNNPVVSVIAILNVLSALGQTERVSTLRKKLVVTLEHQIDVVPEDVRARMVLANNYAFLGNKNDAAQQLEKAVAMRPNDASTLYNAAWATDSWS